MVEIGGSGAVPRDTSSDSDAARLGRIKAAGAEASQAMDKTDIGKAGWIALYMSIIQDGTQLSDLVGLSSDQLSSRFFTALQNKLKPQEIINKGKTGKTAAPKNTEGTATPKPIDVQGI